MPLDPAAQAAVNRLRTFYEGDAPYDPASNPGGFRRGGNIQNFVPALKDTGAAAKAVGDLTDAAASASDRAVQGAATAEKAAADARFYGTADAVPTLGTAADLATRKVSEAAGIIRTSGAFAAGDPGAAEYVRVSSPAIHRPFLTDADGKIFQLVSPDGYAQAKQVRARGNGVADDTSALRDLAAWCAEDGLTALIPKGIYRVTQRVVFDFSGAVDEATHKRFDVIGQGAGNTVFFNATGGDAAVEFKSDPNTGALNVKNTISGLKVTNTPGVLVGVGFRFTAMCVAIAEDIEALGLDLGIDMIDCHSLSFKKLYTRYNNGGIRAVPQLNLTGPNSIDFFAPNINYNQNYGGYFGGGSECNFYGGQIEGNGKHGALANRYGLKIEGPGRNGSTAINAIGTYFEGNAQVADVWMAPGNEHPAVWNFIGCLFNRVQGDFMQDGASRPGYAINPLRIDIPAGYPEQRLNVIGNTFRNYGYTPAANRKFIEAYGTGPLDYYEEGNVFENPIEYPVIPSTRPLASAVITGSGSIYNAKNVASVTKLETGKIRLKLRYWGAQGLKNVQVGGDLGGIYNAVGFDPANRTIDIWCRNPAGTAFVDPGVYYVHISDV